MRLGCCIWMLVLAGAGGCAGPEVRFTRSECLPVVRDDVIESVRFISDFEANAAVPEQQLVFQVSVVDAAGQPIQSRTGKYKDESGNLMAAKGVMVLQAPWTFENINVAIPTPELNAAREDGATHAEFRLASPDGQILARQRVSLPADFVAAPPARTRPIARGSDTRSRREQREAEEAPEVASTADEENRREPTVDEARPAPPRRRPPSETNETASARGARNTRRGGSQERPEAIVRESQPEPGERSTAADSPPALAKRDARTATPAPARPNPARPPAKPPAETPQPRDTPRDDAARRPARDTELESVAPRDPEPKSADTARKPTSEESGKSVTPGGQTETIYTVKGSDSLRSISLEHYGDAQHWPMILRANPDVNPLKLKAGDKLVLPALDSPGEARSTAPRTAEKSPSGANPAVYVTKEGDTLPAIAKQIYGDSRRWREIYDLNRDQLETPSAIRVGQRLKLPAPAKAAEDSRPPARP